MIREATGMNMQYCGESAGVLANKFMQMLTRRRRETIDTETKNALMTRQENRCDACGDLLKKIEKHHRTPVAAGGSDHINNLALLCPYCHATDTEKQEQAHFGSNSVYLESRLSPQMHTMFTTLPLPKQIHWGDEERQAQRLPKHGTVPCLDVVGGRSNFFLERTRDIPIGCPLDQFERVFVNGQCDDLTRCEWLCVDVFEQ